MAPLGNQNGPPETASLNVRHDETTSPKGPQIIMMLTETTPHKWLKANRNGPIDISHKHHIYMDKKLRQRILCWKLAYLIISYGEKLRQRILCWKLTETASFIYQYYEYYVYLYRTKVTFIWSGITSRNVTLKIKPKGSHLYHTKITFVW